jgi:hypothetical protein
MGLLFWKVDHGDHFYKNIEHIRRTDRSKIRSAWSQTLRTPLVFGHVCYCCRAVHDICRGRLCSRFHRERSDSLFCATAGWFALGGRHRHRRRSDHTRFLAIITTMAAMGEAPGVSFGGGLFDRVGRLFRVCVFWWSSWSGISNVPVSIIAAPLWSGAGAAFLWFVFYRLTKRRIT